MIVYIENDDYNEMIAKIFISKVDATNNYEYSIIDNHAGAHVEGTIYNHVGGDLELVEKILHGRNVS